MQKQFVQMTSLAGGLGKLKDLFIKHHINDVIDGFPRHELHVEFPKHTLTSDQISALKIHEASHQPILKWSTTNQKELFTVILTDPDAPSRDNPNLGEWLHWLVINVPGNQIELGNTIAEYSGPAPPAGTGAHRYIILIFKQPTSRKLDPVEIRKFLHTSSTIHHNESKSRSKFKTRQFSLLYSLDQPIHAGAFFLVSR